MVRIPYFIKNSIKIRFRSALHFLYSNVYGLILNNSSYLFQQKTVIKTITASLFHLKSCLKSYILTISSFGRQYIRLSPLSEWYKNNLHSSDQITLSHNWSNQPRSAMLCLRQKFGFIQFWILYECCGCVCYNRDVRHRFLNEVNFQLNRMLLDGMDPYH